MKKFDLFPKVQGVKEYLSFDNWGQLIINRILFQPGIELWRIGKLEILVDRVGGDVEAIRSCLSSPMYKQLLKNVSIPYRGARVLDLGANAGGFALLLAHLGYSPERLVSVEMNPDTYRRLSINLWRNFSASGVDAVNFGVAGIDGNVSLTLGRGDSGDSIFASDRNCAGGRAVNVRLKTFDGLVSEYLGDGPADLCKIDIEGAEWDVLLGVHCSLIKQFAYLIIEIHPRQGCLVGDLIARIESLGFAVCMRAETEDVWLFSKRKFD